MKHRDQYNSYLPETLVSLAGQLLGAPSGGNTLHTLALGHTNDVHILVLREHGRDGDLLLKVLDCEVNLITGPASIELDFHYVGLLGTLAQSLRNKNVLDGKYFCQ